LPTRRTPRYKPCKVMPSNDQASEKESVFCEGEYGRQGQGRRLQPKERGMKRSETGGVSAAGISLALKTSRRNGHRYGSGPGIAQLAQGHRSNAQEQKEEREQERSRQRAREGESLSSASSIVRGTRQISKTLKGGGAVQMGPAAARPGVTTEKKKRAKKREKKGGNTSREIFTYCLLFLSS